MVATNSSKRAMKLDSSQSFENIQIVKQPGSISLGFVKSESGKSKHIFGGLWTFLTKDESQNLSSFFAIGCDGAPTNVGIDGGVIRLFEEKLKRPLRWIISIA